MDKIKEAFQKVRQDTDFLREEIQQIRADLNETREEINLLNKILLDELNKKTQKNPPTQEQEFQTASTNSSTHNYYLGGLKDQNIDISTGNEGVPTDKQTNRQTDKQTQINPLDNAQDILDSLDNIKKEIRLKFKRLTEQEFLVFSTLYQLDEELGFTDYKAISNKLNLSQSSIRDYIGRLIKKGIPIDKIKINNKNIQLSISQNLKKIVTLPTILQLRDL